MKWLQFILSHSVFIAVCAAALSLQTLQLLQLPVNGFLLLFIFFATLCGYNSYWLLSKFSFNNTVAINVFIRKHIGHIVMILTAIAGMIYCMLQLHLVYYNIAITFFLTLLYSVPLWPVKQFYFSRKLGFLKTVLLAFTWAHVTTLMPLQKSIPAMNNTEWLIFLSHFLFMLMLCIIFDSRDAAVDKIRGLHSLATDLNPVTLCYLIGAVFTLLFAVNFILRFNGVSVAGSVALQVAAIAVLITYYSSSKKQGYLFYYFLVDGLMLFSAIATFVACI